MDFWQRQLSMIFNMYMRECWMDLSGRSRDRRKWRGSKFPGVPFCNGNSASIICSCMHKDGWKVLEATPRNLHLALPVATPGAVSMVTVFFLSLGLLGYRSSAGLCFVPKKNITEKWLGGEGGGLQRTGQAILDGPWYCWHQFYWAALHSRWC